VSLPDYLYNVDQLPSRLIEAAVDQIATLPGIGRRTALRLALSLLRRDPEMVHQLADSLKAMSDGVKPCNVCHNLTEDDVCTICQNSGRDANIICVVEDIRDLLAIENLGNYRGVYHVLGGVISPMDGIGPSDLFIQSLLDRVQNFEELKEIIFALPATMEGETTSFYLFKKLKSQNIRVTSLARGVAVGESLQYADEATLSRSIENRTLYKSQ
tara:strand:- start:326 stop:967 length:642 start_codon:yes stop_codon:yes gene_type:complete